jgi:hypothetical protein
MDIESWAGRSYRTDIVDAEVDGPAPDRAALVIASAEVYSTAVPRSNSPKPEGPLTKNYNKRLSEMYDYPFRRLRRLDD